MEMFVGFSEIMHFFKKSRLKFILVVLLFGILFGLMPLKFFHQTYSGKTTFVVNCGVSEGTDSDYHLQYTNILYSRVQSAVALASGNELVGKAAAMAGVDKSQISNISAVQENSSPVVTLTAVTTNAAKAAEISDSAAQILTEELVQEFPSPKLTAVIVDKATPVAAKSRKSTMMKAGILGLIIGFIVYVCAGIIIVLSDKTIRNSHFAEESLKTRLLAEIPSSEKKKEDSFRRMRAAALRQAGESKNFLIANVCENDGGDLASAGFAKALAQAGKKVLIIDADFRSPKIAKFFGITPEKTIADVLGGSCTAQQVAIPVKSVNGLSVLAASPISGNNPADIFAGSAFSGLLTQVSSAYDYVVLYAPSENRYSDAQTIAPLFGASILAVKYGSTPYNELKETFGRVSTAGGKIIGFVTTNT